MSVTISEIKEFWACDCDCENCPEEINDECQGATTGFIEKIESDGIADDVPDSVASATVAWATAKPGSDAGKFARTLLRLLKG